MGLIQAQVTGLDYGIEKYCWRDGFLVKRMHCSCREPELGSQITASLTVP